MADSLSSTDKSVGTLKIGLFACRVLLPLLRTTSNPRFLLIAIKRSRGLVFIMFVAKKTGYQQVKIIYKVCVGVPARPVFDVAF